MSKIKDYELIGELKSDNSGYSKWGFARKNGREYFIKEFLSPIYPLDNAELSPEQIQSKRNICDKFAHEKNSFYSQLNKCVTGNIVTISEFFRDESKYYIVTEKIPAIAMSPLAISKFGLEQKYLIIKVILHCINSLHENGIVHCDIKPDNILFKKTRRNLYTAKIIDFDSSFLESNPPKNDEDFQGDMVYLAPESFLFIAEEEARLTTKLDIFALGVLFHQYFCGELPGYDKTQYDYVFEAVLDDAPLSISPEVPAIFRDILLNMLDKNPDNRPTAKDIFKIFDSSYESQEVVIGYTDSSNGSFYYMVGDIKSTMGSGHDKKKDFESTPVDTTPVDYTPPDKPKPYKPISMDGYFKKADDL